jgi:hypothetical protein
MSALATLIASGGLLALEDGEGKCLATGRVGHTAWCMPSPRARRSGIDHLELDLRQAELVRPLHRRERDRKVLDREPGRVEERDLLG